MDKKKQTIKYEGKIELNNINIDCYVLENGTRVLSGREMQRVLKMVDGVEGEQTGGSRLTRHLNQKSMEPFFPREK